MICGLRSYLPIRRKLKRNHRHVGHFCRTANALLRRELVGHVLVKFPHPHHAVPVPTREDKRGLTAAAVIDLGLKGEAGDGVRVADERLDVEAPVK